MMSSVEQLVEKLDRKHSIRRKELTALDLSIKSADPEATICTLLRASVPIIEPVSAYTRNLIDAESNLSSETLKEVFRSIGLDFSSFWETRRQFIDQNMVKLRNEIAHGEMRPVTREEYDELKEFIQAALKGFKESIEEAARGRIYLKEPVE